jgi:hypothetical protein
MTRRWQRELDAAEATRIAEEEQIARVAAYLAAQEAEAAEWNEYVVTGERRLTLRGVQRDLQQAFGSDAVPCEIPLKSREEDR